VDFNRIIKDLNAEEEKLERLIASFEELQRFASLAKPPVPDSGKRRGRTSMGPEERQGVSDRMKKYWASRRTSE
jgi:hypothetical protein